MQISSSEEVDTKCRSHGRSSIKHYQTTTSFADYAFEMFETESSATPIQEYDRIIRDQIQKGVMEDIPEMKAVSVCSHYLSNHAIVKHNKNTSKVRVVYDAPTRVNNRSLFNDCLQVGSKYNQRILDILIRFRWYKTALIADIEKAFLIVGVREKHHDALRFLWVNNIDEEHFKIRPLRFKRVMVGVCSSPFLLNSTIQHHLEQYRSTHPDLIERLVISFYVDDLITGASDEAEALQIYTEVNKIMKKRDFNLRKFHTNNSQLQQKIKERNAAGKDACTLLTPHTNELKVLGISWEAERDKLVIDLREVRQFAVQGVPTKRHVVSTIGRFYDPLGIMTLHCKNWCVVFTCYACKNHANAFHNYSVIHWCVGFTCYVCKNNTTSFYNYNVISLVCFSHTLCVRATQLQFTTTV